MPTVIPTAFPHVIPAQAGIQRDGVRSDPYSHPYPSHSHPVIPSIAKNLHPSLHVRGLRDARRGWDGKSQFNPQIFWKDVTNRGFWRECCVILWHMQSTMLNERQSQVSA